MHKACLLAFGAALVALPVTSVALAQAVRPPDPPAAIYPGEAISRAADAAPRGVRGRFVMKVRAVGRAGGRLFLNSEEDYRDQRNLAVAVPPGAARAAMKRLGLQRDGDFVGRRIAVDGVAERVRIDFTSNRRPTEKYYYQTYVRVSRPGQISLAE